MKRRVARIGPSTLMVSLPSKWVKQHKIAKGQELDVQEVGNNLLISSTNASPHTQSVKVDLSGMTVSMAWQYITAIYQAGVEEIVIYYTNEKIKDDSGKEIHPLSLVQSIADYCIGMEIVKQTTNCCVVREISTTKPNEFETTLRRMFFMIMTTMDDLMNGIKSKNKDALKNIYMYNDTRVNKFYYYGMRILSKTKEYHPAHYILITHLEEIGDALKYLALQEAEHTASPAMEKMMETIKIAFSFVARIQQQPSKEVVAEYNKKRKDLREELRKSKTTTEEGYSITKMVNHMSGMMSALLLMYANQDASTKPSREAASS